MPVGYVRREWDGGMRQVIVCEVMITRFVINLIRY